MANPSASQQDSDVENETTLMAANYARSKRRIVSLEDELEQLKNQGIKRKSQV
jgi:hypothetical protein